MEYMVIINTTSVAQLVKRVGAQAGGRGFKSRRRNKKFFCVPGSWMCIKYVYNIIKILNMCIV